MLTAAEVAALLGISRRTVPDIPEAQLPRYRMGRGRGAVRFDPADVETYRASCRSTVIRRAIAGSLSSAVVSTVGESELASAFRALGVAPRPSPSTSARRRACSAPQLESRSD